MIFFQYEGIAVGENITMANLKSTLETFIHMFFGFKGYLKIVVMLYV